MVQERLLRETAQKQCGYFSARQALQAGHSKPLQSYHIKAGNWEKTDWAIYRLTGFPDSMQSEFVRCSLWAMGRDPDRLVVVSHESALWHYGLLPQKPEAVHLTVSAIRKSAQTPGCVLHSDKPDLPAAAEIQECEGFRVTTPAFTLMRMRSELLRQRRWIPTVELAWRNGLLGYETAQAFLQEYGVTLQTPSLLASGGNAVSADSLKTAPTWRSLQPYARRESAGRVAARSFTLVEMLVVVAIIAILAGFLLPSLRNALSVSYRVACANNQRQLAGAMNAYCDNNAGFFLPHFSNDFTPEIRNNWSAVKVTSHGVLYPYMGNTLGTYFCPGSEWFGPSWSAIKPAVAMASWNDTLSTGNSVSGYANCGYALQQIGDTRLLQMKRPPAIFSDALYAGVPVPASYEGIFTPIPAINHGLDGVNATALAGSVRWWSMDAVAAAGGTYERNTYSGTAFHGGASKFWSLVSGFNLKYVTVY